MANDTARIKANISKMIDQGAPESDIDAYVASEGTTSEALRGSVKDQGGFGNALLHGASGVVSGVGKTIKDYISPDVGKAVEARGDSIAPTNYKPAAEEFKDSFNPTLIPRGLTEALPGLSTDVIAGLAGKALLGRLGAVGGLAGSYIARTAGDNAEARAQNNNNAEPSVGDKAAGLATSGAGAALNTIGAGRLVNPTQVAATGLRGVGQAVGNTVKTAASVGAAGAGSDVVDQVGQSLGTDQGLQIDPRQALASGVMSAAAGGVMGGPRGIKDTLGAVRMRDINEHPEAASAVANRMVERAGSTDALGDPKQAFSALRDVHNDIIGELGQAKQSIDVGAEARNALDRTARGERLTPGDIAAVDAIGNPQISGLVKQADTAAGLKGQGSFNTGSERFAGGLAETARNAVTNRVGTVLGATGGLSVLGSIGSGATAGAAMAALPTFAGSVAGGLAAYKVLQKIEKGFGTGAPARTFAEKFADPNVATRPAEVQRPKDIAAEDRAARAAVREQVQDAVQLMMARRAEEKARRAQEVLDARNTREQAKDASELMAARRAEETLYNRGNREQAKDASDLMAARRSEETLRNRGNREQARDATELMRARRDGERIQRKDAEDLMAARRSEEVLRNRGDRAQMWDASQLMQARRALQKATKATDKTQAQARHGASRTEELKEAPPSARFEDFPEAPWALENHETAARMAHDFTLAQGGTVNHKDGYLRGVIRRIDGTEKAFDSLAEAIKGPDQTIVEEALAKMKAVRSEAQAREFRDAFKEKLPAHQEVIDKTLNDDWIKSVWTSKKKK